MKHLLNSTDLRRLEFLKLLFDTDEWLTLNVLATQLNCSAKSLRNDLRAINEIFAPFSISTSVKRGLKLSYPENFTFDYIYSVILSNSLEFNFLELIFFNEHLKKRDLEDYLYVSTPTVSRLIKKCADIFAPLAIKIQSSPYRITGNEIQIQNFYVAYFSEKYLATDFPYSKKHESIFLELLNFVPQPFKNKSTHLNIKHLTYLSMVCLTRLSHGNLLESEPLPFLGKDLENKIMTNNLFMTDFQKTIGFKLTPLILSQLFYLYYKNDYLHATNFLPEKIVACSERKKLNDLTAFLTAFQKKLGVNLHNKEELVNRLYKVQFNSLTINFILYDKRQHFATFIKTEYPFLIELLLNELPDYLTSNSRYFNEFIYTLIIYWPNLLEGLGNTQTPISIGIFSTFDYSHTLFICDLINYHFHKNVLLTIIEPNTAPESLNLEEKYDLIISNNSYSLNIPLISINSIPTNHDWKNIKKSINRLLSSKNKITTKYLAI